MHAASVLFQEYLENIARLSLLALDGVSLMLNQWLDVTENVVQLIQVVGNIYQDQPDLSAVVNIAYVGQKVPINGCVYLQCISDGVGHAHQGLWARLPG